MSDVSTTPVTPAHENVVTAREALEPLYEKLELETDRMVLTAAVEAGWSADEAAKALATLRLDDALATLRRAA